MGGGGWRLRRWLTGVLILPRGGVARRGYEVIGEVDGGVVGGGVFG